MSIAHTPGPWHVYAVYAHVEIRAREDSDASVALIFPRANDSVASDAARANARLIAAAPDLLEALQRLLPHAAWMQSCSHDDEGIGRDLERARAAIGAATGGST
jgi:hypothetical protein